MSVLNEVITGLVNEFAVNLVAALGKLSVGEFAEISGASLPKNVGRLVDRSAPIGGRSRKVTHSINKTGDKRVRRTVEDIREVVDSIVQFVRKCEDGATAESIRFTLGLERKELPRPIAEALAAGLLMKRGQKRATRYFVTTKGGLTKGGLKRARIAKKTVKAAKKTAKMAKKAKKISKKDATAKMAKKSSKKTATAKKRVAKSKKIVTFGKAVLAKKMKKTSMAKKTVKSNGVSASASSASVPVPGSIV
jgi:hypothetical protein